MPSKFVFPGGAVDDCDYSINLSGPICQSSRRRLQLETDNVDAKAFFASAIREVWEETGIRLAVQTRSESEREQAVGAWLEFMSGGMSPCAKGMYFFFRAITPPGRSRRFDARFFLGCAEDLHLDGDIDKLDAKSDELANLQWASLAEAQKLDMPFISRLVLDAAKKALTRGLPPTRIPFHFQKDGVRRKKYLV